MNNRVWCRTMLTVYKFLGTITSSLDKCISRMSCNIGAQASDLAEKIISYTQNKIELINLKLITERIFLKLPKELAEILMLRYVDNMQNKEIAELKNLGMRTYFRKLNRALAAFEKEVQISASEHKPIFDRLIKQKWIEMTFEEHLRKTDSESSEDGGAVKKLIECSVF